MASLAIERRILPSFTETQRDLLQLWADSNISSNHNIFYCRVLTERLNLGGVMVVEKSGGHLEIPFGYYIVPRFYSEIKKVDKEIITINTASVQQPYDVRHTLKELTGEEGLSDEYHRLIYYKNGLRISRESSITKAASWSLNMILRHDEELSLENRNIDPNQEVENLANQISDRSGWVILPFKIDLSL